MTDSPPIAQDVAAVAPADADGGAPVDPLREQLLEAAARVFASKGYSGARIVDIVREAGLSAGAVYGRFDSKNELLTEAVVSRSIDRAQERRPEDERVADFIVRSATEFAGPLSDTEAMQLEAFVAARREPEVATALAEARRRRRGAVRPLMEAAIADGTAAPNLDADSVLYLMETIALGLLLQRGAGMSPPDPDGWRRLIEVLVGSMAGGGGRRRRADA